MERNSRKLMRMIEQAGWSLIEVRGDHHHFRHPAIKGKVTIPHPNTDMANKTERSIYKQAGWIK